MSGQEDDIQPQQGSPDLNVPVSSSAMMAPDVLQVPPHFDFPAKLDLGQSQPTPSASIPVGSVNALDASNGDAAHAQLQKDVDLSGLLPALDGRQAQGDLVQGTNVSSGPSSSGPGFFPPLGEVFAAGMNMPTPSSHTAVPGSLSESPQPLSQPGDANGSTAGGNFAFPPPVQHRQSGSESDPFGGFASHTNSSSDLASVDTARPHDPNAPGNANMPLLSRAAEESYYTQRRPPSGQASASTSTTSMNFPDMGTGALREGDSQQSSTYDEISRTAPWLLSATSHQNTPPTSAARSTDDSGMPGSASQAFVPLHMQSDTLPIDPPMRTTGGDDDDEDEDDAGDDPNDQDYQPQAPGFMSNPLLRAAARSNMNNKRSRPSIPDIQTSGDVYLPAEETDDEDDFAKRQQEARVKKPRKSGPSTSSQQGGSSTPGSHRCDFVDEHGSLCDTPFKRPYDLARHKETKHGLNNGKGKPEWACRQCKHNFSRKDALLRHQRVRHHS